MEDIIEKQSVDLRNNIVSQIDSIHKFIGWSQRNLSAGRQLETVKKLIDKRRQLKRILFSLSSNPAIAAFGESQKGKSYVISSLLASANKPFTVKDENGQSYNFIEEINPHTNNTEATGVVTRFTFAYDLPDPRYPVKLKMLSVADIVLILCDSYFHDVNHRTIIEKEDINEFAGHMSKRYSNNPDIQNFIDEDALFDIRDYMQKHMANEAHEMLSSEYFDTLSFIIRKIQISDLPSVLSKLWCDNSEITSLFVRLLEGYSKINFSQEVFVPITAVLNTHTTLMSSDCLKLLADKHPVCGNVDLNIGTDLAYVFENKVFSVEGFNKSFLSAMTAEAVYKIDGDSIGEKLQFCMDGITSEEIRSHLLGKGWNQTITRDFLRTNDILDFPGARSRLLLDESQVPIELYNQMFLRGKVSYLFNKYSEERLINVLLFCHDYEQNGPAVMPPLLKGWIGNYVGNTPAEREENIDKSIISPLFIVATKFNKDLELKASESANNQAAGKWAERFNKVLYKQVLMATSNDWFDNWTTSGSFKNTYLLRDFKFSGDKGGDASRLFHGYAETGNEVSEYDAEFRAKLKESFLQDADILKFFADPELAWDSSATLNNDGSLLVIQNLAIVASHTKESRNFKCSKEIKSVASNVSLLMQEYYHDENEENILQRNIVRSGAVIAELDVVCGKDNYFFGRMIQNLQINENQVFDFYYNLLNGTKMTRESDLKEYDLILGRCHGRLSAENSFEENLEILCQEYHFPNVADCREFFEKTKSIDLNKLFECNIKQKSNSVQMAEGIVRKWLADIVSQKNLKFYENQGCNTIAILDLIENMKAVVKEVKLIKIIAGKISPFVDAFAIPRQILDMIADVTAEIINRFVVSMGYTYYSAAKLEDLKMLSEKNSLHMSFDYEENGDIPMSDEELSFLFDDIRPTEENASSSGMLRSLPSFIHYSHWTEMVMISFIAAFHVADYDVAANKLLGELIMMYNNIKAA